MKKRLIWSMAAILLSLPVLARELPDAVETLDYPFLDHRLPTERRIEDLLSRLTVEEKISQLVYESAAIPRLNIPEYNWWNEALHGVARAGRATVFPQAIGLAATWDTDLMLRVSTAISDEARAKYHQALARNKRGIYQGLTFWSPNINIFRDPRWGRGMETFGEDPFLTARLGVAFIKGMQGDHPLYLKTVATPKHYAVHSGPEPDRHQFDAVTDERDLRETYLPHFEACVREAGAWSVMCAYNRYLGEACCASPKLLMDILRNEWGFKGYVVSDCGAVKDIWEYHKITDSPPAAAAMALKAGCDLNCGRQFDHLVQALEENLLTERDVDTALRRLLLARFKLGMFDPPELVPYSRIPASVVDSQYHRQLALEATRKSIVLLKNDGVLPLSGDLKTLAVIGPNAHDVEVLLGNYNGFPSEPITPLQGLRDAISSNTRLLYAPGCTWADGIPVLEGIPSSALESEWNTGGEVITLSGLKGEYFNNRELRGKPVFTRLDRIIDFNWWDDAPDPRLDPDDFGIRWTGHFIPPRTGKYAIGSQGFNGYKVFLDDKELLAYNGSHQALVRYREVTLEKGRRYPLKVEFFENQRNAHLQLLWSPPGRDLRREALEAASQADVVIMCLGLSPRLEGEELQLSIPGFKGGDRTSLDLPAVQKDLLREVHALGKPVVLVLLNGSALAVNWAEEHVAAIVECWYPGQAAGQALAEVLSGKANPAGRLPVTFYQSVDQVPSFNEYAMAGRTYRYFEGAPLYPFGYGLSYSRFEYSNLRIPASISAGESIQATVTVTNLGPYAGDEVVQLYLKDMQASVTVPVHALQGFRRIFLQPGDKTDVEFTLLPRQLALLDQNMKRVVEPGDFEISVGSGQPGQRKGDNQQVLTARITVTGEIHYLPDLTASSDQR